MSSLKYYAIISNSYLDFIFADNSLNCIVKLSELNKLRKKFSTKDGNVEVSRFILKKGNGAINFLIYSWSPLLSVRSSYLLPVVLLGASVVYRQIK